MSAVLALVASTPAFMTFICAPSVPERANLAYVVSFEQAENRVGNIVVLWPNGSQSHDRWRGQVFPTGFQLDARKRYSSSRIVLSWDAAHQNTGKLAHRSSVWGGHVIIDDEDLATCIVRSEADQVRATQ